jgi:hypothetical protein
MWLLRYDEILIQPIGIWKFVLLIRLADKKFTLFHSTSLNISTITACKLKPEAQFIFGNFWKLGLT